MTSQSPKSTGAKTRPRHKAPRAPEIGNGHVWFSAPDPRVYCGKGHNTTALKGQKGTENGKSS